MQWKWAPVALALSFTPAAVSATTFTAVPVNQGFIAYDSVDSHQDLGDFNLGLGAVALTALFTELNTTGSLEFGVFSDPLAPGASGQLTINLTKEGNPPTSGSDNEIFSATFGGQALTFQQDGTAFVAQYDALFSSITDIIDFRLDFTGFDPGDQFDVNVAQVSAIPLPAPLALLMGALGGLCFLGWRRKAVA